MAAPTARVPPLASSVAGRDVALWAAPGLVCSLGPFHVAHEVVEQLV